MNHINSQNGSLKGNKNFRLLAFSSILSLLGDQLTLLTIPWLVLFLTSDSLVLGSVMGTLGLPMSILILLGGVFVDRFSPKIVLLCTKIVSATVIGSMSFFVYFDLLTLPILYVFVFLLGTCTAFMLPAASSLLPKILKEEQLQPGNGILMFLRSLATLIGPLLAGYLLSTAKAGGDAANTAIALAFGFNAVSYLFSTLFISGISGVKSNDSKGNAIIRDLSAAFTYIWNQKILRLVILYTALAGVFVSGPIQVSMPLLVKDQLGGGGGYFGIIVSAGALGGMIGMLIAAKFPKIGSLTLGTTLLIIDMIVGASLAAFSYVKVIYFAVAVMVFLQMFVGYIQVAMMTWIQHQASEEMLGRMMSIVMFTVVGVLPLSAFIAGYILTFVSAGILFRLAGISLFFIAISALLFTQIREVRQPLKSEDSAES